MKEDSGLKEIQKNAYVLKLKKSLREPTTTYQKEQLE